MTRIARAARILLAALREIFDESPYQRFLARNKMQPSRQSYAAFWRERENSKAPQPRCC